LADDVDHNSVPGMSGDKAGAAQIVTALMGGHERREHGAHRCFMQRNASGLGVFGLNHSNFGA
jgi:hypothetical protein